MTTSRKIFTVAALAATALFVSGGVAFAGPKHVDDGGHHGGHSNSHKDHFDLGDDNNCNYKYRRDGSQKKDFDNDNSSCPDIFPVSNPDNIQTDPDAPQGSAEFPPPPLGFPPIPGFPF
jgi:hypothetical protein